MRTSLLLVAALLIPYYAFVGPAPASAADPSTAATTCLPTGVVLAALAKNFNESVVWHGTAKDIVLMLTESPGGKTWTLLGEMISDKDVDTSCILDSGKDGSFKRLGNIV